MKKILAYSALSFAILCTASIQNVKAETDCERGCRSKAEKECASHKPKTKAACHNGKYSACTKNNCRK